MRLTALEASFLYMESPTTPMHVGSVAVYDGRPWRDKSGDLDLARLRRYVRQRLAGIPQLRQHPVWPAGPAGRPCWVDDTDFHISRHVRSAHLEPPGTEHQMLSVADDLLMPPLDRDHPLWELWFVDGMQDGRVAVVEKIHHALVDGIGGVDLAVMLLDPEPSPERSDTGDGWGPPSVPSRMGLFSAAAVDALREPQMMARQVFGTMTHPRRTLSAARSMASALGAMAHPAGGGDIRAPHTFINEPLGAKRSFDVVRRSLGDTRELGHALGGTVNDVVLTAVASGIGALLGARGEQVERIRVLVPISLRAEDEHHVLGNRVTGMVVPLTVEPMEPLERFRATHDAVRWARNAGEGELTSTFLGFTEHLPEPVIAGVSRLVHHQPLINLVVTNVPGPSSPLFLMGSQMLEAFPVVPLAGNLALSVGILSYLDQLTIGLWADRAHFPDLHVLAKAIGRGFDELDAARPAKESSNHEPTETPTDDERIGRSAVGHRSRPKSAVHRDGGDTARPTASVRRSKAPGTSVRRRVPPPAPTSS